MTEHNAAGQPVHKLLKPIVAGEETITEFTFRDPTVADLKKTDRAKGDAERTAILIAALSGHAPPIVDKMSGKDFQACGDIIAGFFE